MISRDIQVVDIHPDHWVHLVRGPLEDVPRGRQSWLVIIHHDGQVIHALRGVRQLPELLGQPVGDLTTLKESFDASRVISLERDFLRRSISGAEAKLSYDMDYVEQLLTYLAAFREERGGGIRMEPPSPPGPVPPFALLQLGFDRLWPDGTSLVLFVVDEEKEELFTSLILRKQRGDVDLLTTDLHFGSAGLDAVSWRLDHARLLRLVEEKAAPPFLGVFATLEAWKSLYSAPAGANTIARLRTVDELIVDPFPRRLAWIHAGLHIVARVGLIAGRFLGYPR